MLIVPNQLTSTTVKTVKIRTEVCYTVVFNVVRALRDDKRLCRRLEKERIGNKKMSGPDEISCLHGQVL